MPALISFLIWLALIAIVIYAVIWAIVEIVKPPARVVQIMYVIGVLLLLYYVVVYIPPFLPRP